MDLSARLSAALEGRYEILREIGRGGVSVVYLARDLSLDREVALKVLRPELLQSVGAERFQREIQLVAHFEHIHLLPLHESGTADGALYYVMPYARDGSLRDLLRHERQFGIDDIVRITAEVADGLAHAHAHGVVHRDIKPENILFIDGHAVIADFGIAHAFSEAGGETLTSYGVAIGTPAYMSPEQAAGDPQIDHRTDIYSLACVVYEMLSGGPPFEGPTTQAVLAKQMHEQVPSLAIVRPGVPAGMVRAVEQALAKVPADRFKSATEFARAFEAGVQIVTPPPPKPPLRAWAVGAIALVVGLLVGWRLLFPPASPLDPNRVVVFPLAETGLQRLEAGIGGLVAEMIGTALEGVEPLRWTYGGSWLGPDERQDPTMVSVQLADSIAERVRARYHVLGSVLERGDSTHVILRLHDVELHDEIEQRTARGLVHIDSVVGASYRATIGLVANLLEGDRDVELDPVIGRNPAAVTLWMRGDQEYRQAHFARALELYRRALASDSLLAMAALKGAWAANWRHRFDEAEQLLVLALGAASELSAKHVHHARGLQHYLAGAADSAVAHFSAALDADPQWPEAWTALAETHRHLLLDAADADSIAVASFRRAMEVDPEFTPPLLHLVEYALWRGDIEQADRYADRYREVVPDGGLSLETDLMVRCARVGPALIAWDGMAQAQPFEVLAAAVALGVRGSYPQCAEAAYRAVLASPTSIEQQRWGALLGLQSLLLAMNRLDEARPLLDTSNAGEWLYLLDAGAGYPCGDGAFRAARSLVPDYRNSNMAALWLYGQWLARRDSAALVIDVARRAAEKADSTELRRDRLIAQILVAYASLAAADTAQAIELFRGLKATGRKRDISWQPWESLGAERMVLARLLEGQGRHEEAYRVAATLDHPEPIIYPLYLPESLELRARAADALGWRDVAARNRARLASLRSPAGGSGR